MLWMAANRFKINDIQVRTKWYFHKFIGIFFSYFILQLFKYLCNIYFLFFSFPHSPFICFSCYTFWRTLVLLTRGSYLFIYCICLAFWGQLRFKWHLIYHINLKHHDKCLIILSFHIRQPGSVWHTVKLYLPKALPEQTQPRVLSSEEALQRCS